MTKNQTLITKTRELIIEELDLGRKREAVEAIDKIRKKHRLKTGEKTSTEIIRYFRESRHTQ